MRVSVKSFVAITIETQEVCDFSLFDDIFIYPFLKCLGLIPKIERIFENFGFLGLGTSDFHGFRFTDLQYAFEIRIL